MNAKSKMDTDQLQRCVKHYHFLSPRFQTSGFSNYTQKTDCSVSQSHIYRQHRPSYPSSWISPLTRLFSSKRASCEGASATDVISQAEERLKQEGVGSKSIVSEIEIQNYLAQETGKDRLLAVFTKDHKGEYSPESKFMYQATVQAAGVTFLLMSFLAAKQAKQDFIENNTATVFKTRFQAIRRMNDKIFLFSMKEGISWAARISFFTITFLGISQGIAVYRNKSSPLEYSIAAGATFGLLKLNMGLRAFTVATSCGLVMGGIMGLVVFSAMKALNETQEQRHYWEIQKMLEREKFFASKGNLEELTGL